MQWKRELNEKDRECFVTAEAITRRVVDNMTSPQLVYNSEMWRVKEITRFPQFGAVTEHGVYFAHFERELGQNYEAIFTSLGISEEFVDRFEVLFFDYGDVPKEDNYGGYYDND